KAAVFKVKIHEIKMKELPELDDDFAQDVSDCDTLEEYREDMKKKLQESKEEAAKRAVEDDVVNQIIENASMDIPEPMVNMQTNQMIREFAQNLQYQGLSVEQYMQFTGMTQQSLIEEIQPQALKRIQSRLVLEAVAEAEGIDATEEEVEKELENMATMYQLELDKLKERMSEGEMKQVHMDIAVQKAVDFVVDAAVEK
ncbi:MAG TPA: trigger factor, partial [Lachnospiraceae bacterium]|nr:trigger factor [Lachnospiraceae bacterium]